MLITGCESWRRRVSIPVPLRRTLFIRNFHFEALRNDTSVFCQFISGHAVRFGRLRMNIISLLMIAAASSTGVDEASAQKATPVVRDAVYRGTLVCTKLPFISKQLRTAIEATVTGDSVRYKRPVVMANSVIAGYEEGSGSVDGHKINLKGAWKNGASRYEAIYNGSFVRRSAKLTGTQNWTHDGKMYTRTCTGSIKRPLAAFLRKDKKN